MSTLTRVIKLLDAKHRELKKIASPEIVDLVNEIIDLEIEIEQESNI